ncbi:MAG: septum formation protein Maf [Neisseriaceae bacterium]|nr:septum formation protein Maf [Neisseriaceae bacterium]
MDLILASTSLFRREMLSRLKFEFQSVAPCCEENTLPEEKPYETALRLAECKAKSLQDSFPDALIIGSDQVAFANNRQYGKPLTIENAQKMLHELSGQKMLFYTALVVINTHSKRVYRHLDETTVYLRKLSNEMISNYLQKEHDAIHCAGAAKSESLGMMLIDKIESTDPNALIGLPMFRLIDILYQEGFRV